MTIKDKKECCYVIVGGNTKSIKQHSNIQHNILPSLFSILLTLAILEVVSDQFVTASEVLPNESLFVEDNVTSSTNNLSANEGNKPDSFPKIHTYMSGEKGIFVNAYLIETANGQMHNLFQTRSVTITTSTNCNLLKVYFQSTCSKMSGQRIVVITGSSSGIGFETSLLLAKSGFYTYATVHKLEGEGSRQIIDIAKKEKLPLEVVQLDVNSDESVTDTINSIVKKYNRIDVIVNNAGYALGGALEETSMDEIRKQFETNFFGAVRVMRAAIPFMRIQRSGKIINITSMGGRISIPLSTFYHGSKFALEGVSESLQYELEPFGIKMILIEPGAVGSNFWKSIKIANGATSPNSPYTQLADNMSKTFKKMEENAMRPSEVAKTILNVVTSDDPQLRYVVGNDATKIIEARQNMSDKEFGNLIKDQFKIRS